MMKMRLITLLMSTLRLHPITAFPQVDREFHLHIARSVSQWGCEGLVDLKQAHAEALHRSDYSPMPALLSKRTSGSDGHADADAGLASPGSRDWPDEARLLQDLPVEPIT